jgi:hypothetical protein
MFSNSYTLGLNVGPSVIILEAPWDMYFQKRSPRLLKETTNVKGLRFKGRYDDQWEILHAFPHVM